MHIGFRLISDKSFFQTVCNRAIIKLLQGAFEHTRFITNTHKLVAALYTIEGDLADDFVKALREELFTNGADSIWAGTHLIDFLFQTLL